MRRLHRKKAARCRCGTLPHDHQQSDHAPEAEVETQEAGDTGEGADNGEGEGE